MNAIAAGRGAGVDVGTRWLGVGSSNATDARCAGSDAAAEALCGREARLMLVFCSDGYELEQLLASINERSGDAPLIGCSTAGEIATAGPADASVVVVAFG